MTLCRLARRFGSAVGALTLVLFLESPVAATTAPCLGDCNLDFAVTVDELVRGVNIALGLVAVGNCPQFDRDNSGTVSVDEIVTAVQNALAGCPRDGTPTATPVGPTPTSTVRSTVPMTPNFTVRGKVLQAGASGGGVSVAADAEVSAEIDRNGNGQIDAGESATGSTDLEGTFVLDFGVVSGEKVVVGFRTGDSAPAFRTLDAMPGGDVVVNVTLRTAEELTCTAAGCSLQGDRLSIEGLPSGVTGMAQVFNPVTQADAFPGDFADNNGDVLLSGVFASIELTDSTGKPVDELATPAMLRMQVPRETWSIMTDITPGNGRIDVPLYAFDEVAGTWVREGAAVIENDAGTLVPEGSLANIRNGSYAGNIFASGQVQHFSFWNVDWPIDSHGCVGGTILDVNGQPAAGAALTVRGVTYVGTSTATADSSGRFCVDVLRSESPGEDVDQDGVPGETQRVAIRATYGGRIYDVGEINVPTQPATCSVGCADIGSVRLTPDRELQAALCTFNVVVRDRDGAPVPGAFVIAGDETIDPEVVDQLCSQTPQQFCLAFGSTNDSGQVSLTAVVLDTLFIAAVSTAQDGDTTLQRWGEATSSGCPSQPVQVTLTDGYRQIFLTVELDGPSTIRWTPTTYGVTGINVAGFTTQKWLVVAESPGFAPPVSYGSVPPGATQVLPFGGGAPPPLASGDFITVFLTAPGDDGYTVIGQGFAVVP